MDSKQLSKIKNAFESGTLRVQSVSPEGSVEWKSVQVVSRAEVPWESIWKVTTEKGSFVATGGHRVFTTPTSKVDTQNLIPGSTVLGVCEGTANAPKIVEIEPQPSRQYMYDLTVEDWHNFTLVNSGVVVSNSPDRNYRFRPPEHEGRIGAFNRVFGQIWEDEELVEYLETALQDWNAAPPETEYLCSLDQLCQQKGVWEGYIIVRAMWYALYALAINWVSEEFSYSIGGISLDIDRSSKYEGLKSNAEGQWDKAVENKMMTTKYISGLQQPRYGLGIRSAFGPHLGRGILSPRAFV